MDINSYQRVCHSALWFGKKLALAKVLKEAYHKGWYCDSGGKIEKGESVLQAVQRETEEETGLYIPTCLFEFIDCYIYDERKIKTFLFEVHLHEHNFQRMENTEPTKLSPWKLYTVKQALKLKLMPSVRNYLENL